MRRSVQGGFSLIELIVVLLIMVILASLSIPALNKVLRASSLTSAGTALVDSLNYARQTAQTRNLAVEVRLYRLPDYGQPPSTGSLEAVRAYQMFLINEDGTSTALDRPEFFNAPVVISRQTNESGFFNDHIQFSTASSNLGEYGINYDYVSFYFKPGGGTSLGLGYDFITLVLENEDNLTAGANFYTVQIDPINGGVRAYRP